MREGQLNKLHSCNAELYCLEACLHKTFPITQINIVNIDYVLGQNCAFAITCLVNNTAVTLTAFLLV